MGATFGTLYMRDPATGGWQPEPTHGLLSPAELAARAAAHPQLEALYLDVGDSDAWGVAILAAGDVVVSIDGLPLAADETAALTSKVLDAADRAFGLNLDANAVQQALTAEPVFAEEAMAAFASFFGVDAVAPVVDAATSARPGPRPPAEAYDIHLHASVDGALPRSVLDHVGALARVLGGEGRWYARTRAPADPLSEPEHELDAPSTDEDALRRIADLERSDELAALTLELDAVSIFYETNPIELHLLAPAALDAAGAAVDAGLAALLLGDDPALHHALLESTDADYGYATTVPVPDPGGAEAIAIREWPARGHWLDHLGPALVQRCGGPEHVGSALDGLQLAWRPDGALRTRLPVAPHRASDPDIAPLRDKLRALLARVAA